MIPARGGSKRIPRKNIRDFLGKPILAYAIETAQKSNMFKEIMVSTDDEEIADVALRYGAKVPFLRSDSAAADHATTFEAIAETIHKYKQTGFTYTYACCLYPCTPLLDPNTIKQAFEKLSSETLDCVFPVSLYSPPIQRALSFLDNGKITMRQPQYMNTRSQDLEKSYHDSGQFYFFHVETILEKQKLFTDNSGAILLSEMEMQDIDNLDDWDIAELKYQKKHH